MAFISEHSLMLVTTAEANDGTDERNERDERGERQERDERGERRERDERDERNERDEREQGQSRPRRRVEMRDASTQTPIMVDASTQTDEDDEVIYNESIIDLITERQRRFQPPLVEGIQLPEVTSIVCVIGDDVEEQRIELDRMLQESEKVDNHEQYILETERTVSLPSSEIHITQDASTTCNILSTVFVREMGSNTEVPVETLFERVGEETINAINQNEFNIQEEQVIPIDDHNNDHNDDVPVAPSASNTEH